MMKKLVAIVAIAGALTACNNGTDSDATIGDSTSLTTPSTVDSTTVTTPMDSSAVAPMVDTTTAGTSAANSSTTGLGNTSADSASKQ
jgi:hypothetical protein